MKIQRSAIFILGGLFLSSATYAQSPSSLIYRALEVEEATGPSSNVKSVGGLTCVQTELDAAKNPYPAEPEVSCTLDAEAMNPKEIFNALSESLARQSHDQNSPIEQIKSVGYLTCTSADGGNYQCTLAFAGR